MTPLALLSLAIWAYLLAARDGFWLARDTDAAPAPAPAAWPAVTVVVPARDEAAVIARSIGSLLAQDYAGDVRIVLVDDGSRDGTGAIARRLDDPRLTVIAGTPPPAGWTGKLWAMATGVAAAGHPDWLWFTDADIAHAPDTLASLVARGEADGLAMNSLMARLETGTIAERALIPAFVLFFQMLYPFARVNRPGTLAAAAGGCMLIRRQALEHAGGIAAIRHAIIDDCAMGRALKAQGPIRLTLTRRSASIRPYGGWRAIGGMIARSAYAQLRYSPALLAATVAGMGVVYLVPVIAALSGHGAARWAGIAAWAAMAVSYLPMLRFYRLSPLWAPTLPAIGGFYGAATIWSAIRHWQGRGGMWKGRAQAGLERAT